MVKPIENRDFDSLVDAINALTEKGYTETFITENKLLKGLNCKRFFQAENLKVVQTFRFEGQTNPSDQSELMAVEANDGTKGMIITTYSYDNNLDPDVIKRIPQA
jgi:hypothetical protein